MVATAPRKPSPILSDSLFYNHLRVNNPVAFALPTVISNFRRVSIQKR
jgi:ABC-type uncharacterized transport system YnjBCD ATPase subunit